MPKYKGWAGKILRVNLSTGAITTVDTANYIDYVGGMGIGYKVMWDEVPVGTKPYDEANKVIVSAGPVTGSGAPCTARTTITSLWPANPFHLIADGHMGGHFSPELKYAGWDAVIIEGKASRPVWLRIEDDKVTLENASRLWGQGIFKTTADIVGIMGKQAQVAAIGQAGENMLNLAVVMNNGNHSAGGLGGVWGSKNFKAIGVIGTGSVEYAADRQDWMKLNDHIMEIIGSNNQHVVPMTPQPWSDYHDSSSRWTADKGMFWGAADEPVETGICPPGEINKIGYRCLKSRRDHGKIGPDYTVRMGGCQSCPIRCMSHMEVPELEQYGYSRYVQNSCSGWASDFMIKGFPDDKTDLIGNCLGAQICDDYGLWDNYGQIGYTFKYAYNKGILKKVLPADEYNDIPWDLMEAGDPAFMLDIYDRIVFKKGEISHIADGTAWLMDRWGLGEEFLATEGHIWNHLGYPRHHANESWGQQVGTLINVLFNRDAQCHSHSNFFRNGLPVDIKKQLAAEIWGAEAIDPPGHYSPMNKAKARMAAWAVKRNLLHDSMTICNWMFPMAASPLKDRGYRGDTSIEAQIFSLATGMNVTEEEFDKMGLRLLTLHRALTVKQMGTVDMRNEHDRINDWVFDMDPDKKAFEPGTIKMDREDMDLARTMLYEELNWDPKTGAPTYDGLVELGMTDIAEELKELGLLPG